MNYNNNTLVSGTSSADSIFNYGSKVTIGALAGNDSIQNGELTFDSVNNKYSINGGSNISIDSETGNDYIGNYGGNKITIDGNEGNDVLHNYGGKNASINGGNAIAFIYGRCRL